ncbi:MAG: M48 family metalloprotease, partial [Phycisphaerales bacterium]|nr:M48 family metalloprotease [Phycisphaerales bacterium]
MSGVAAALGSAVLHFLWQGLLVGGAAGVITRQLQSASDRYAVGFGALLVCLLAFVVTFAVRLDGQTTGSEALSVVGSAGLVSGSVPESGGSGAGIWAAGLWLLGVGFCTARLAWHWECARRLSSGADGVVPASWLAHFERVRRTLGIGGHVRLVGSTKAVSPMVVGWLKPVVIVPMSAFTALTPAQLEAVMAHELSHIRRCDHLLNGLQTVIEVVLFFHPVTWWLSGCVRREREYCCDEAALTAASPRDLATALGRLELIRQSPNRAALAASGGSLMHRITRILGSSSQGPRRVGRVPMLVLAAAGVMGVVGLGQAAASSDVDEREPMREVVRELVAAGAPIAEAHDLYHRLVAVGDPRDQRLEEELAAKEAWFRHAVESGSLSADDAAAKLAAVREGARERAEIAFAMEVLDLDKLDAVRQVRRERLDALVEAGKLSRADADAQLAQLEKRLAQATPSAGPEKLEATARELRAAVAAGKLSAEQAEAKMAALRAEMERNEKVKRALAEIKRAVEAG